MIRSLSVLEYLYLLTLPFIVFSGLPLVHILISVLIGVLLYRIYIYPSIKNILLISLILLLAFLVLKPKLGLDMGLLNSINAQRGEHSSFQTDLLPKLLHNKSDLSYSFISNLDKLLSPVAIFISGFWHHISKFYPLGYLFPWDIYFIYRFFRSKQSVNTQHTLTSFLVVLSILILISGLFYIDQAIVFSLGIVFFISILSAHGYTTLSLKARPYVYLLNYIYLAYHAVVSTYFRI